MIKQGIGALLDALVRSLDQEMSAADVRSLVEDGYHQLASKGDFPQDSRQDLHLLETLMEALNWQTYGTPAGLETTRLSVADFGDLNLDNCFLKGVLRPGSGRYLDIATNSGPQADALMERLLRHVEVRRQNALRKFSPILSMEAQWLERCDISILFSRFARCRHDLRFLNAALKMNEWYLKETRRFNTDAVRVRLLLALTEQELSAKELLAC